jgi:hypothetical protein
MLLTLSFPFFLPKVFNQILQLLRESFFKHGEENILKACVKALAFCWSESQAELQDAAQQTMKLMEDELVVKLRTAINQAGVSFSCSNFVLLRTKFKVIIDFCFQLGDDDYPLIVNLRRLYQMQLNKAVLNDSLFADQVGLLENYSNIDDEVDVNI